ncbi:MAG: methyltransferase [Chloroflexi bacterium]|nr:methyltransferase [Chloroflexota bacterium]
MIPDWLPYLLNGLLLVAIMSIAFYGIKLGITPMPSSRKAIATFIDLIPDRIHAKIVDLGSGWGSLAYPIAKRFPEAEVIGYELSPLPWLYSRIKGLVVRRPNLSLLRRSVFDADLSDVDVVVVYLHPAAMRKLGPKFERELRPGTLVLSNTFPVPTWEPVKTLHLGKTWLSTSNEIYVYRV